MSEVDFKLHGRTAVITGGLLSASSGAGRMI
jgi:hypothetical protein